MINLKISGVVLNKAEVKGNSYYSYYYSDNNHSVKGSK